MPHLTVVSIDYTWKQCLFKNNLKKNPCFWSIEDSVWRTYNANKYKWEEIFQQEASLACCFINGFEWNAWFLLEWESEWDLGIYKDEN